MAREIRLRRRQDSARTAPSLSARPPFKTTKTRWQRHKKTKTTPAALSVFFVFFWGGAAALLQLLFFPFAFYGDAIKSIPIRGGNQSTNYRISGSNRAMPLRAGPLKKRRTVTRSIARGVTTARKPQASNAGCARACVRVSRESGDGDGDGDEQNRGKSIQEQLPLRKSRA